MHRTDADDVELATCQFYGWAFLNRQGLLPTREQDRPRGNAWLPNIGKKMAGQRQSDQPALFVTPIITPKRPLGCIGRGRFFLSVTRRHGAALPQRARQLPVDFPSVLEQSLECIWYDSFGFNLYRGFD